MISHLLQAGGWTIFAAIAGFVAFLIIGARNYSQAAKLIATAVGLLAFGVIEVAGLVGAAVLWW